MEKAKDRVGLYFQVESTRIGLLIKLGPESTQMQPGQIHTIQILLKVLPSGIHFKFYIHVGLQIQVGLYLDKAYFSFSEQLEVTLARIRKLHEK